MVVKWTFLYRQYSCGSGTVQDQADSAAALGSASLQQLGFGEFHCDDALHMAWFVHHHC